MEKNDYAAAIMAQIHSCTKCGELRIMLCYHMLPPDLQKAFEMFGTDAEYLYCGNCNEFSALTGWERFDSEEN